MAGTVTRLFAATVTKSLSRTSTALAALPVTTIAPGATTAPRLAVWTASPSRMLTRPVASEMRQPDDWASACVLAVASSKPSAVRMANGGIERLL